MTVDLNDLAEALRGLLVLAAVGWMAYAWWGHVAYRRIALGLAALALVDYLAHAFAAYAERPDSNVPTDFSVYSLFILLAALLGLTAACFYGRQVQLPLAMLLDAALVVVLAGAVGARAYHVLSHWDYYAQNLDDITNLAQGGMGLRGAFILGLGALLSFVFLSRTAGGSASFWKLADAGAIGLVLAQSIGWYAAQLVGANYGVVSDSPLARDLPDVYGLVAPRMPVQWLATIFFFGLFVALAWTAWRTRPREGMIFLTYLIFSALGGWVLGAWRADETLNWNGWRIDQWIDVMWIGVGLVVLGMRISPIPLLLKRGAK